MNAHEEHTLLLDMIKATERKLLKKNKDRLFLEAELQELCKELKELELEIIINQQ